MQPINRVIAELCDEEVLQQIFLIVVGDYHIYFRYDAAPWTLAAVCRRWRAVALSTPSLWTQFGMGSGHECQLQAGVCISSQPAILRCCLQLERSQALPIDVLCKFNDNTCAKFMLRALAKHAHRWRSLRYDIHSTFPMGTLNQLLYPPVHFAALRHLEQGCDYEPARNFQVGPHFSTTTLPALTSLRLEHWYGELSTGMSHFPWAQLQQISLVEYIGDQNSILSLLRACSSAITHFSLSATQANSSSDIQGFVPSGILLSELVQLEFDIPCSGESKELLQIIPFICTPKLLKLSLTDCGAVFGTSVDVALVELISRSKCNLRSLDFTLDVTNTPAQQADENAVPPIPLFFEKVSQYLEDLVLMKGTSEYAREEDCNVVLQRMLIVDDATDTLFPHLAWLKIKDSQFDPVLLAHVIQSRWEDSRKIGSTITPLGRVEIDYDTIMSPHATGVVVFYSAMMKELLQTSGVPSSSCQLAFHEGKFLPRFSLDRHLENYGGYPWPRR